MYKIFIKSLIFFPLILLLVNIFNIFFPKDYRNDPYLVNGYFSKENQKILNYVSNEKTKEILKYEDAIKKFDQLYSTHGETLKFLSEASKIYFLAKIPKGYSWKKRYTKIKFQENWILYLIRKFEEIRVNLGFGSKYNNYYTYYLFSDYKFALKRGISICSQDVMSFANLLKRRYNIDSNIIGLNGHVVMQAKIENKFYLSDPNMGLAFNFSIDEYYNSIENQLKIKNVYTSIGQTKVIEAYNKEGNRKFKYTGPKPGISTYNPDALTYYSNYIKWLLPLFLLFVGVYLKNKKRKV